MSTLYRRRVGALGDVKELEYLSALHQTVMPKLRQDATVSSLDVARFLKSRVGLIVPEECGVEIVQGLGGGRVSDDVINHILDEMGEPHDYEERAKKAIKERTKREASEQHKNRAFLESGARSSKNDHEKDDVEDPSNQDADKQKQLEYLDLVQITSILLMPTFARAAQEWQEAQIPKESPQESPSPPDYHWTTAWFRKQLDKRQKQKEAFNDSLKPKPEGMIRDVLVSMLKSINRYKEDSPPLIDASLVSALLVTHGECERAADPVLVDKMVEVAGGEGTLLNEVTFVKVLTGDLKKWEVGSEDENTTTIYDVWGFDNYEGKKRMEEAEAEQAKRETSVSDLSSGDGNEHLEETKVNSPSPDDDDEYKLNLRRTLFAFDSAVDAFSSTFLFVAIFLFFICTALVYAILFQRMPVFDPNCGDNFGCTLVSKIITWGLFAIFLSLVGYCIIPPLSMGNNPETRYPALSLLAFILAIVYTILPLVSVELYKDRRVEEPYDGPEATVTSSKYYGAQVLTLALGCLVALVILYDFVISFMAKCCNHDSGFAKKFVITSVALGGGRTKRAATRKINRLLQNASAMHPIAQNSSSHDNNDVDVTQEVMVNYVMNGESFEYCGGLSWTWRQIITRDLFEQEGIWIMSRLLTIQVMQVIFIGFGIYALNWFVIDAIRWCEDWQANLQPGYPQWVYDFVPSPEQAKIALYPAFGVAVFIMVVIFFVYLPSYVRIITQLRCGILPSLTSKSFMTHRFAVDSVYTNVGNALYALFGAAILFFFLIALVIFLFIWPFSREFMTLLLAWGLGLLITILIKMVVTKIWRAKFYAGFYRTKPFKANWSQLALECWFLGLGGGVLVGRFTQFILAACFFVGRIDVPFLSPHVSLFGYSFDYAPMNFVKDVLVHEAHRHPYMERLLAMYMMKLRYANEFGTEAASCWRQLFVVNFMPWMVRYRVFRDERLGDSLEEYNAQRRGGHTPLQVRQLSESSKVESVNGAPSGVTNVKEDTIDDGQAPANVSSVEKSLSCSSDGEDFAPRFSI